MKAARFALIALVLIGTERAALGQPTGRPVMLACSRPQASVQAIGSVTGCSNAASINSSAMRRMVSAVMPQRALTASGEHEGSR